MADNNEWTVETVRYNKVEQYNRIKMGKKSEQEQESLEEEICNSSWWLQFIMKSILNIHKINYILKSEKLLLLLLLN